jgi:iron complex transport system substrate-binding protein
MAMKKSGDQTKLRIVSLAPSATSILCAIGARSSLVGVTKWCLDVAPVAGLPQLGDCWRMEAVEEILKLRPTLVIGSVPYKQETVAKLLQEPLNFLAMNPRTLADVYADIRLLASIVGRAAKGESVIREMRAGFASIQKVAKAESGRVPVYCEAWPSPRISSPPWVAELVEIAGGEMVVPAGERVNDAQVGDARPEVVVLAWAATGAKADPQKAYEVEAWQSVPAIRNKQVYVVRDELLNTPGPPLVEGARELFRILHTRETIERRILVLVVAAVIERNDRRLLIGQRRRDDTSPLKWEFPGGKVREGEAPEAALARELQEELGAEVRRCAEIARVTHQYSDMSEDLEIRFFAAELADTEIRPAAFEQVAWVLPRELGDYDFLAANARLVADLATGRIKPRERLSVV